MEEKIGVQKNENENKPQRNRALFTLKIIGNVIFYLIIVVLFVFALMNIRGGKQSFPNIFGRGFLSVQSSSMERNPDKKQPEEWNGYEIKEIKKGDLVFVKTFSGKVEDIKVGDVITWFDSSIGSTGALNTHRIVYINAEKGYVIAQGDKVAQTSPFDKNDPLGVYNYSLEASGAIQNVSVSSILGVTTGTWSGAGKVLDNMQKNWLWYFVVPVAVILLIELFFVFKNIMDYRNEKRRLLEGDKAKEDIQAELEAEREKMKAELLAELKAQGVIASEPQESPIEETEVVEENKTEEVSEDAPAEEQLEDTNNNEIETEEKVEEIKEEPKEDLKEETEVIVSNPQETVAEVEEKVDAELVSQSISDIQDAKDAVIVSKEIENLEIEKGKKEVEKAMKKAEQAKKPAKSTKATKAKAEPKTTAKATTTKKTTKEEAPKPAARKKAGEGAKTTTRAKAGETKKPAGRAKAGSKTTKK